MKLWRAYFLTIGNAGVAILLHQRCQLMGVDRGSQRGLIVAEPLLGAAALGYNGVRVRGQVDSQRRIAGGAHRRRIVSDAGDKVGHA